MSNIKRIRGLLGVSQRAFAAAIGCTQGAINHYEQGRRNLLIDTAKRIKAYAAQNGLELTLDQIYGMPPAKKTTKALEE